MDLMIESKSRDLFKLLVVEMADREGSSLNLEKTLKCKSPRLNTFTKGFISPKVLAAELDRWSWCSASGWFYTLVYVFSLARAEISSVGLPQELQRQDPSGRPRANQCKECAQTTC